MSDLMMIKPIKHNGFVDRLLYLNKARINMNRAILIAMAVAISHHSTNVSAFTATTYHSKLPSRSHNLLSPSKHSIHGSSCLLAYRERSRYDQKGPSSRSGSNNNNNRRRRRDTDNNADTDDFVSRGYDEFDDDFSQEYNTQQQQQENTRHRTLSNNPPSSSSTQSTTSSTFYSQKSLSDPTFSLINQDNSKKFFQRLCNAANIKRPSRIQSLAWPPLLQNENCIVADQTGSGKTLSYLLPLLQKLHSLDTNTGVEKKESTTQYKKKRTGTPRVVVLTPTAELADQIYTVCSSLSKNLADMPIVNGEQQVPWTFNPFVTTATGSHSTNIRDQIRLLQSTPIDILISTPGRLSTILRTKNAGLDLGLCTSLVLDEVDFLLVDETFGPQLRTVGVAVNSGGSDEDEGSNSAQFIFVTATLPEDVLESIQSEFENIVQVRGPGLHRITPAVSQTLIDVSVPATSNRDARACFDIKVQEMLVALRGKRCSKTLIFCNTVETCRNVENVLRRKDRKNKRSKVWAYHNALSPEVRLKNLQMFSSSGSSGGEDGEESILVCTDRAARGIDFDASPIDHVLLFDFPKDPAEYVRRVGRTARAGRTGACTVLAYGWQLPIARQIMGLSDGKNKKGKKKKRGSAVLEAFTMMKSDDGWDDDGNDEYVIKNGERRRKAGSGGGEKRSGTAGDTRKRKPGKKRGDKGKPWEK